MSCAPDELVQLGLVREHGAQSLIEGLKDFGASLAVSRNENGTWRRELGSQPGDLEKERNIVLPTQMRCSPQSPKEQLV